MSRRKSREVALQALFQLDFNAMDQEDALQAALAEASPLAADDENYARTVLEGTRANLAAIDAMIAARAREWKVERMGGVDRNIARLALYELKFGAEQLSPGIVINEAVELAKRFGAAESARFINGVLGSLARKGTSHAVLPGP